jgi:hypothetical protein
MITLRTIKDVPASFASCFTTMASEAAFARAIREEYGRLAQQGVVPTLLPPLHDRDNDVQWAQTWLHFEHCQAIDRSLLSNPQDAAYILRQSVSYIALDIGQRLQREFKGRGGYEHIHTTFAFQSMLSTLYITVELWIYKGNATKLVAN